jgi:hypothetical protein
MLISSAGQVTDVQVRAPKAIVSAGGSPVGFVSDGLVSFGTLSGLTDYDGVNPRTCTNNCRSSRDCFSRARRSMSPKLWARVKRADLRS